jgi:Leucine-rich repeat (LRR) protein
MAIILGNIYALTTTYIYLSNRGITSEMLPDLFENINKLSNLTGLNLSCNQITSIPENIFDKLTNLMELSIHHNQISTIPENIFDKLTKLVYLGIYDNHISATVLPSVAELNTSGVLPSVAELNTSGVLPSVAELNTSGVLPRKLFKRLIKLKYLYISEYGTNDISKRYIKLSKEEKLRQKMKMAKLRTDIFKEELYMKILHYSKINLFDTSYF